MHAVALDLNLNTELPVKTRLHFLNRCQILSEQEVDRTKKQLNVKEFGQIKGASTIASH